MELAAYRLTAPGIGGEVGAMLGTLSSMFKGLFLAPHMVGQALKGCCFRRRVVRAAGLRDHIRVGMNRGRI